MERPSLPIHMRFKTRLNESVMLEVRIMVTSMGWGLTRRGTRILLDGVPDDSSVGVHTRKYHQAVHLELSCHTVCLLDLKNNLEIK